MLTINGVTVVAPKSMSVDIEDIDVNTERNANGQLVRDRIATKRKLSIEWGMLTPSEMAQIQSAISGVFFNVTFIDPLEGQTTKTMYAGNKSSGVYNFNQEYKLWSGVKVNLIEK